MEFIQSIKAHLYDKTTSPLFGAFAASWIAFNYELIFILGSDIPVHDRFEYISTFLYCGYPDYLLKGFLYPLLSSITILLAYPYPARKIYGYWKSEGIKQHNLRLKLEGESLISKKKEREIRKEAVDMEIKYENEINKKDLKIQTLTDLINELHTNADEKDTLIKTLKEKTYKSEASKNDTNKLGIPSSGNENTHQDRVLDDDQINTLLLISKHEGESIDFIVRELSTHDQVTKYNVDKLKNKLLITTANGRHRLTPDGRKLLVEGGYVGG